ncbi:unnamed protein product [Chrysoparadoxa australica]
MDEWPGGVVQQYGTAGPLVEEMLMELPAAQGIVEGEEAKTELGKVVEQVLDSADAVGMFQLQCARARDDATALLFPNTDSLDIIKQIVDASGANRLVALVNPQFKGPQDFGFFGRAAAEKQLGEFETSYELSSLLIYGYTLRLLKCYPSDWTLFLVDETGETAMREVIGNWPSRPTFEQMQDTLFAIKGKPSPADRIQTSARLFQDGM